MNRVSVLQRRILYFSQIIVTGLCSTQIYSIASDFMKGETTSKVNLSSPPELVLPNLSLCFPFLDLINITAFSLAYPKLGPTLNKRPHHENHEGRRKYYSEIYAVLGNLTPYQLNGLLKNVDNIITEIRPTQLRFSRDKVTCHLTKYLREPNFCYTISCTYLNGSNVVYPKDDIFEPIYDGQMLYIGLNENISQVTPSLSVIFTASGHLVQGSGYPAYQIDLKRHGAMTFIITYTKIISKLLSGRFETSCRNYTDEGYKSQRHFIDKCLNNFTAKNLNSAFYGTIQFFDQPSKKIKSGFHQYYKEFLNPNQTEKEQFKKLFRQHREFCQSSAIKADCFIHVYSPVGDRAYQRVGKDIGLIIRAPTLPFEWNEYFPEYTTLDLLIYLGSSLNFWFGLSLVSILKKLLNFGINWHKTLKTKPRSSKTILIKVKNSHPINISSQLHRKRKPGRQVRIANVNTPRAILNW